MRVCTCCNPPRITYCTKNGIEVPDNTEIVDLEESSLGLANSDILERAGLRYHNGSWCTSDLLAITGLYVIKKIDGNKPTIGC